jgi:hypothetical protein
VYACTIVASASCAGGTGGCPFTLSTLSLGLLHGIDLRVGPDEPFLHDDKQVRQWLAEFRLRCGIPY